MIPPQSRVPPDVDVIAVVGARKASRIGRAVRVPAVDQLGADTFPPSSPAPVGSAAATRYTSALEAFLARSGIAQSHRVCARTYNARGGRDRGGARGWSRLAITLVVPDPHVLHSIVGRNRRRRERRDDQRARNSRMF